MTGGNRDWRESAYLKKENWPEAIPPMGPKREYGPYPWGEKAHHDPRDIDDYQSTHPDAASIGETYMGDVCPYCGVPLDWANDEVVLLDGSRGTFCDINEIGEPEPAYHPKCWLERQATIKAQENRSISDYAEGES